MGKLSISTQFDSGAIEVVRVDDSGDIELNIRRDTAADIWQWFHFRLSGAAGLPVTLRFLNASQCTYPKGWEGYNVVASHDRENWFRISTEYDGTVMTAQTTPDTNSIYFAYFEPYSYERHLDLIGSAAESEHVQLERLGSSLDGRDVDLLRITDARGPVAEAAKKKVWLIARQHPGEAMAEWFVEGFLERLLDADDPVARVLLEQCIFHVVPNMNPDGGARGNLRTNAAGTNLNREWLEPSMDQSPEVFLVRQKMQQTGADFCLDAHGDEALPYNFLLGAEGIVGFTPRLAELQNAFKSSWVATCPDFQVSHGYGSAHPTRANPTLATNWIAQAFDCLAFTLEMPFKDNADLPDEDAGWNGERSRRLGASVLLPMLAVVPRLR
ncbi:MAG: carboxypeptidase family protein [Rhodoferax sp.]|nr:carboxypeptidase family protein [Rhodoferax sp.]